MWGLFFAILLQNGSAVIWDKLVHSDEKNAIKEYILHQEYVDNYEIVEQEVEKWLAIHRKIEEDGHPLLPMRQCIHLLQALWNRSKGGSDTATQAFRAAWFPLPNSSRTPQGYVCQKILYLMIFQVMKLYSLLCYENDDSIDKFRNRINRTNVSFSQIILMIRQNIIIPTIRYYEEGNIVFGIHHSDANSAEDIRSHEGSEMEIPETRVVNVGRRLRSNKTHTVTKVCIKAKPLRTIPLRYNKHSQVFNRIKECKIPMGLVVKDKIQRGKTCANCGRRTRNP